MNSLTDVIAAVSTPPGKGGVAVIRMSGAGALDIASRAFLPISGRPFSSYPARTEIYGYITNGKENIDDVMAAYFPAPNSYTGEDTVEISCHGGILITRCVLEALLRLGARPALGGEFTRRAFINGKLSLTDAEAIGNLLEAKSEEQVRLAATSSRERLNSKIAEIRGAITDIMSSVWARIDYPEEDLGEYSDKEVANRLSSVKASLKALIDTYRTGRAINEGISAVLCGKPNVGKSSIYNAILDEDAAIVTDIAGTTRDILERSAPLGRIVLRLSDTAGIREKGKLDEVEKIGIQRSRNRIAQSELIIAIFDLSRPYDTEDREITDEVKKASGAKVAVLNKADIENTAAAVFDKSELYDVFDEIITVSAKDSDATRSKLSDTVNRLFTDEKISTKDTAIVSSARQHAALVRTLDFIELALEGCELGFSQDAVSSDIERALGAIAEIDGRAVSDEVVSDIFSKFCVGK